nr:MAG TPA: hypothetical protein [Caudoviricetes sp.]
MKCATAVMPSRWLAASGTPGTNSVSLSARDRRAFTQTTSRTVFSSPTASAMAPSGRATPKSIWPEEKQYAVMVFFISHTCNVEADGFVLVGITNPLIHADVGLGADHLAGVANGLHGALPAFIGDFHTAQRQDAGCADVALLVSPKGIIYQRDHFGTCPGGPVAQALINQCTRSLEAFVESDAFLDCAHDLETPIEADQADISLLATDLGAVLLSTEFDKGFDITEGRGLELRQHIAGSAGFFNQAKYQGVPLQVYRFDQTFRDQPLLRVDAVAFGNGLLLCHCKVPQWRVSRDQSAGREALMGSRHSRVTPWNCTLKRVLPAVPWR